MPIRFHPEADAEMTAAAKFYETQQKDLGKRFLASVQDAINKIQVNPLLYPEIEDGVRRCMTTMFPFGVVFRIMPDQYVIVAVMHLHRHPGYWKERLAVSRNCYTPRPGSEKTGPSAAAGMGFIGRSLMRI